MVYYTSYTEVRQGNIYSWKKQIVAPGRLLSTAYVMLWGLFLVTFGGLSALARMTGWPLVDGAVRDSPLLSFGFLPCGAGPLPGAILAEIPGVLGLSIEAWLCHSICAWSFPKIMHLTLNGVIWTIYGFLQPSSHHSHGCNCFGTIWIIIMHLQNHPCVLLHGRAAIELRISEIAPNSE